MKDILKIICENVDFWGGEYWSKQAKDKDWAQNRVVWLFSVAIESLNWGWHESFHNEGEDSKISEN